MVVKGEVRTDLLEDLALLLLVNGGVAEEIAEGGLRVDSLTDSGDLLLHFVQGVGLLGLLSFSSFIFIVLKHLCLFPGLLHLSMFGCYWCLWTSSRSQKNKTRTCRHLCIQKNSVFWL